jgi:GNAT superfamily N-acetyltransferase
MRGLTTSLSFERPVTSGRVRLSGLTPEALAGMSTWLPGALAPEWTVEDLDAALKTATGVLISDATGEAIGLAVVQTHVPGAGCASVPLIAIEPSRRFRGLGGEAGIALDAELRAAGYKKVYAPVPDGRGLAVYFWLRLGFRPLRLDEAPGPVAGLLGETRAGIWMMRGAI